jgi:hypothetical protein
LCEKNEAKWAFSDAGLARVFGIKSKKMFFALCDDCRDIILRARSKERHCAKCNIWEGMQHDKQLFNITLADGVEISKPYCVHCLSKGAAREELIASLPAAKRRRRCKSV